MQKLYQLQLSDLPTDHILAIKYTANLETWHRQLGHANYEVVIDTIKSGAINGVHPISTQLPPKCDSCALGKQTKEPIPKQCWDGGQAKRRLEIVWVDLSGPADVESHTGNKYIMNIVDDYLSFVWSIPLKTKDQAYQELVAWQLACENKTGLKLWKYHTDNGELKNNELNKWLQSRGSDHEYSMPYTSAHIRCVGRMHCTLMGKARTMRLYARLPPKFWDEFYLTAVHLHVRTTSRPLKGKVPFEIWYGRKPDYSYL